MRLSASALADYDKCGLHYGYKRNPDTPRVENSYAAFGSVMHVAMHVMERSWVAPFGYVDDNALAAAKATFEHYWHPKNIEQVCPAIEEWGRGHTWTGLNEKGPKMLTDYADIRKGDEGTTLALEFPFEVPVEGTEHTISGYIDRSVVRHYQRKPYLGSDDYKSGRTPSFLRHHVQGHVYCYATTRREFWAPFGDQADELFELYAPLPRRFRWVSLSDGKSYDSWRGERDWARLALMVNAVAEAIERGIFIPTLNGSTCERCEYVAICGDVPLPPEEHGRPASLIAPSVP